MKFIHTSDWHIGKIVNEFHMTEDQEIALKELFNIIEEEKPSALVIAGDLYDRSVAPVEAIELLNKVLNKIIIDLNTPVIAIAGNHDSGERLEFAKALVRNKGLYIEGIFNGEINKVTLEDEYGPVNFYLLPYVDPPVVREIYGDETIKDHDKAMKAMIERIKEKMNKSERNVVIAHGYVTYMTDKVEEKGGLSTSDSERPLSIGGSELINAGYFEDFNYTALGHLHGPQRVGSEKIRYAGSLLKYSFSEVKQRKGVTIVNMDKDGDIDIELRNIPMRRDFRIIKGELNNLIDPSVYREGNREDYIKVILTDEGEVLEPMAKLRAIYPNIMELSREVTKGNEETKVSKERNYKNKSKMDLFKDFYMDITGRECDDKRQQVMEKIIEEVEKGGE